jgi:hypothetical protein
MVSKISLQAAEHPQDYCRKSGMMKDIKNNE